jgi:peroxiredoxin
MTALVLFQGRWCPFCMTELRELQDKSGNIASAGGHVLVVSIEGLATAAETQRDFPTLAVASDERRELTTALNAINPRYAPDGQDCALPTVLLVDRQGIVRWIHRPSRFIVRPGSDELVARISAERAGSSALVP